MLSFQYLVVAKHQTLNRARYILILGPFCKKKTNATFPKFSGPLASFLMQKTSYRKVCLLGAVLSSIGLSALPFTPNIPYMIAFYGIITGSCDNLLIHQFKFMIKYSILFYFLGWGGGQYFHLVFTFVFIFILKLSLNVILHSFSY